MDRHERGTDRDERTHGLSDDRTRNQGRTGRWLGHVEQARTRLRRRTPPELGCTRTKRNEDILRLWDKNERQKPETVRREVAVRRRSNQRVVENCREAPVVDRILYVRKRPSRPPCVRGTFA